MIVTIAGSPFTFAPNETQLNSINLEFAAFDGQIGSGQFPMPDPAAALAVNTGRQFKVAQDFATLTDGFILDDDSTRGPFRVSTQREYGFSVQDANALLNGFRVSRTRPVETDVARVLAFAALDGPAWATTWVLNASTVSMPIKKYESDSGWSDLIRDLVEFSGKTLFLHDLATGGRCLHYHLLTNGHTSGLSISDVLAAQNSVTVWAPQSPVRQRTSIDLRNDIKGRDQTGRFVTLTDATSITAHDADGLKHQALIDFQADSQTDLNTKVAAYLASSKDDYITYTCTIGPLDGTALGRIRVGDLITVTSNVMALTSSPQRISHMRLKASGASEQWMAELELGAPARRRPRIAAAPAVATAILPLVGGTVPFVPSFPTGLACTVNGTPYNYTTAGTRTGLGPPAGAPLLFTSTTFLHYWGVGGSASDYPLAGQTGSFYSGGNPACNQTTGGVDYTAGTYGYDARITVIGPGTLTVVTAVNPTLCNGPAAVAGTVFVSGTVITGATDSQMAGTPLTFVIPNDGYCAHFVDIGSLGSWGFVSATWGPLNIGTPSSGQQVNDVSFIGNGVTTAYTTGYGFAYQAGSLRILVNGLDWKAELTEVSPAAGTYSLSYPPPLGSTVLVSYKAA